MNSSGACPLVIQVLDLLVGGGGFDLSSSSSSSSSSLLSSPLPANFKRGKNQRPNAVWTVVLPLRSGAAGCQVPGDTFLSFQVPFSEFHSKGI